MHKLRFIIITLCTLISLATLAEAANQFKYHTLIAPGESEEVIDQTTIAIKELDDNGTLMERNKQGDNCIVEDVFTMDRNNSVTHWTRKCKEEQTDVIAQRNGSVLNVKGTLKGESIDKEIDLGGKELYVYPKYSLSKFAMAKMPKMKFWTLRRDKMGKIPMKAVHKGEQTVVIDGKEAEAYVVYSAIDQKIREKYYNRTFYYRKSDGLFLMKESPDGKTELLIGEK